MDQRNRRDGGVGIGRAQRRGQLDLRRTLRANAGHGGVPFTLAFKHRRRDKPRVVVVCDVSGSVAAQVRFLLLFLYSVAEVLPKVRAFAFSSHLGEVTGLFERKPVDFELEAGAKSARRRRVVKADYVCVKQQIFLRFLDPTQGADTPSAR